VLLGTLVDFASSVLALAGCSADTARFLRFAGAGSSLAVCRDLALEGFLVGSALGLPF